MWSKIGQNCRQTVLKKLPTEGRGASKIWKKMMTFFMDGPLVELYLVLRESKKNLVKEIRMVSEFVKTYHEDVYR